MVNGWRIDVPREALLAGGHATYVKMPSGAMLLSGPLIGLLYVTLMPFVGIATMATLVVLKILGSVYPVADKSVSFDWLPGNAYLAGKNRIKHEIK